MLDYFLFPLIAVVMSMNTINKVHTVSKSTWASGLAGLFAFLFIMWMAGHIVYGLILATIGFVALMNEGDSDEVKSSHSKLQEGVTP